MTRHTSLARIEREANLKAERQQRAKEEANALAERRAETLRLASVRGEAIEDPPSKRGERAKPMRRLSGLVWLHKKQRIDDDQFAAGMRYGAVYRLSLAEQSIRSILNDDRGGDGPTLQRMIQNSEKVAQAASKLAMYRRQLSNAKGLIEACDAVCGLEKTPREASKDGHEANRLEAVLIVALDMLADAAGATSSGDNLSQVV